MEQQDPRLGPEHIAQDDKRINYVEAVRSQLSQNDSIKIKDILNEGMERQSKTYMKKLIVDLHKETLRTRHPTEQTQHHLVLRPGGVDLELT